MSQVDEGVLPGAEEGQGEVDDVKLVPVGESIRYRRRAQGAEKRVEELAGELAEAKAEATRLADELKATQKEQELMRRLASEGTRDLEAAMLIAKARLAKDEKGDLGGVVEQLKKEKQYLFQAKRHRRVWLCGHRRRKSREVEPECSSGRPRGPRELAAGVICRSI